MHSDCTSINGTVAISTVVSPLRTIFAHKCATNLRLAPPLKPGTRRQQANPHQEANSAKWSHQHPKFAHGSPSVESDPSASLQDAASPTTPSNPRRRSAAASTTAISARQLSIGGQGTIQRTSGDPQFQGDADQVTTGARRRRKPFSTETDAISEPVKLRRRGCDQRHPLETPYASDSSKKCARVVSTSKTPLIASPIASGGRIQ